MSTQTLVLVDGEYRSVRWQAAGGRRCIVEYEGLFVLVDYNDATGWELSGEPARGAEAEAMTALLEETLDKTIVTVTKEEKP